MFEALSKIVEFFKLIFDLVTMILKGLGTMITVIPKGLAFLVGAMPYMPPLLAPFAMVTVTLSVIFFILGRRVE